jgi:hypothetical protein
MSSFPTKHPEPEPPEKPDRSGREDAPSKQPPEDLPENETPAKSAGKPEAGPPKGAA